MSIGKEEILAKKGLNPGVNIVNLKSYDSINILDYKTICIDYVELFDYDFLKKLLYQTADKDIRIIALTQMKKDFTVLNNIFTKIYSA